MLLSTVFFSILCHCLNYKFRYQTFIYYFVALQLVIISVGQIPNTDHFQKQILVFLCSWYCMFHAPWRVILNFFLLFEIFLGRMRDCLFAWRTSEADSVLSPRAGFLSDFQINSPHLSQLDCFQSNRTLIYFLDQTCI